MYDLSGLGARIRQLRMQKGLTQENFARELGISAQAVSKWETGVGCPDIGTLPLIANVLETSIDSLFGEAGPSVYPAPEPTPTEPVPGEVLPVYKEEPEAPREEGVRVVFSAGNLECCSNMTPERIEGQVVYFADGSSADLKTRTVVNYGGGVIKIREAEQHDAYGPDIAERISRQVDEVVRGAGIDNLENLGEIISERINQAFSGMNGRSYESATDTGIAGKPGELFWNGVDIDSLDVSVSGSVDVTVHSGTPGQWSVVARGRSEFLNSLRCIEDGNVLKIESLPYKSVRGLFGGSKNAIEICTGFTEGVELDVKVKGSGDFACEPSFQSSRVSVSGSGDIDLTDAGNLTCVVSGSGDIAFVSAKNANISISGSGDIGAGQLEGISELKISGSGDADVSSVTGQLRCRIGGSGDVNLGSVNLEEMTISVTGSGDFSIADGKTDRLELKLHGSSDFNGRNLTVGELVAELNGPADAVIGRLLGKSVERVNRVASLRILSRG